MPSRFFLLIAVLHSECPASFHCTALTFAWYLLIRVDAANEAVYELVAEPVPEPHAGEQQGDAVEHAPEEIANPADLQGKPQSITPTLKPMQCII